MKIRELITHEQAQRILRITDTLHLKLTHKPCDEDDYLLMKEAVHHTTPKGDKLYFTVDKIVYQNIGKNPDDENRLARPRLLVYLFASGSSASIEEFCTNGPVVWLGTPFDAIYDKRHTGYYNITLEAFVEGNHARPVCG